MSAEVRRYHEITDSEAAAMLARIDRQGPAARVLFRGATVVTMDPVIGDLAAGDLLSGDGVIQAVGEDLTDHPAAADAVTVEAGGMILMPGLIDSHRHAWQAAFRRLIVDADLDGYVATTHGGMAFGYRPDDMYLGSLASALGAIETGITTILDFSHNSRSGAHNDAVIRAYLDSGIRAVHAAAAPNAGPWDRQWPEDLLRLHDRSPGQLGPAERSRVTVRMGIDMNRVRPLPELVSFARSHGLGITIDGVHGTASSDEILGLAADRLLGSDITVIHANDMDPAAWAALAAHGVGVTLAPTSDEQIGIADALPPVQAAIDHGIRPSLSVDVEISLAGDLFSQMRCLLTTQRMNVTARRYRGEATLPALLTHREALEFATVRGAADLGLAGVTGSLTPGLAADVVALRAEELDNMPLNNAIGTIVQGVDSRHVDTVLVAGQVRKWRGRTTYADVAGLRAQLLRSRDALADLAGWTPDPVRPPSNSRVTVDNLRTYLDARKTD